MKHSLLRCAAVVAVAMCAACETIGPVIGCCADSYFQICCGQTIGLAPPEPQPREAQPASPSVTVTSSMAF